MKTKERKQPNESNENLNSALLKILIDLDVALPENISTLVMNTNVENEEENIELEDFESND